MRAEPRCGGDGRPPGQHQRRRVGMIAERAGCRRRAARRGSCAARACPGTGGSCLATFPGRRARRGPAGRAQRRRRHPTRRDAEFGADQSGGIRRAGNHVIGTAHVVARQIGEVALGRAAHLIAGVQEVEVEHGDDLGGPFRRDEQRRRGVHDVAVAGEPLDRRPAGAVPRPGQRPHRDPAIDLRHARHRGRHLGGDPIGPRAREQRHAIAGRRRGERASQLVHVLADAGPRPERRAVIHDHVHAGDGTTTARRQQVLVGQYVDTSRGGWYRLRIGGRGIAPDGGYEAHEGRGRRNGICGAGGRRVPGRERQRRDLRGQGRGQGADAAPRQEPDLRAGHRGPAAEEQGRGPADLHHRPGQGGASVDDHLHRRRHAPGRGRVGRPAARHGRGPRHRQGDERLQGHRRQEHRAGRYRRQGARGHPPRDHPSVQRRQQPRVPEAGRGGGRLHEARPRGHRRRGSAVGRADGRRCTSRSPAPARRSW